jgi:hypothetical protein
VSNHTTRSALPRPDAKPTECRHSREPFDAAFRCINERRDISPAAKLVHAHLVTLHRTGRDATQAEIGEAVGMSRHQVWRAIGELVVADLVQTIRVGLGNPNQYVLLGLAEDDLAGRATGRRPAGRAEAGQSGPRARVPSSPKNETKNGNTTGYKDRRCRRCQGYGRHCDRCSACLPGPHADGACYTT